MHPIIIIGTGLAGYTLAREFRKLDNSTSLTLITTDDGGFYSKPMLSSALSQNKSAEQLLTQDAVSMANSLQATILPHTRVDAIEPAEHTIIMGNVRMVYSKLVLALGASPRDPQLPGSAAARIMHVNSLDDYREFRRAISEKKRVAIIGGGLIGCEFAHDLNSAGFEVHLLHPAAQVLNRLAPPSVGDWLTHKLDQLGVRMHTQTKVERVDSGPDQTMEIGFDNGEVLLVDAVLSAIGLVPQTALAQAAGLQTGHAISVDSTLATSAANIYALGDCAEVNGLWLPYVQPIMQGARALAKTLSGTPTEASYPAMPVIVKTPQCPVVITPPPRDSQGNWQADPVADGVSLQHQNSDGASNGFALAGAAVSRRQELLKSMPAWL